MARNKHLHAGTLSWPAPVEATDGGEAVRPSPYEAPTNIQIAVGDQGKSINVIYQYAGSPIEPLKTVRAGNDVSVQIGRRSNRVYVVNIAGRVDYLNRESIQSALNGALDFLLGKSDLQNRIRDNYKFAKRAFKSVAEGS